MAANDDDEMQGILIGTIAGLLIAAGGVMVAAKSTAVAPAKPAQAVAAPAATADETVDIQAVGDALAKVYFGSGQATLNEADKAVVAKTVEALAAKADAIVLLSGFHDASGDPALNAELAKQRAQAVREALVAGGVAADRVKLRKPESTVGTGSAEEGRRVEIRVQ